MRRLALAVVLVAASSVNASADTFTVGLYAPSVAFDGPVERLEYASALARHVADAIGVDEGVGRVYSRAADFARAVKRGDIDYAVVDAAYLAGGGVSHRVLGIARRNGATTAAWQVVAAPAVTGVLDLEDKRLAVADTGAKTRSFVLDVVFEGELDALYFKSVSTSPDALSAVAAVTDGKADAALVPTGTPIPSELSVVTTLRATPWPALVAFDGAPDSRDKAVAAAAASFSSRHALDGFSSGGAASISAVSNEIGRSGKPLGPLAVPRKLFDIKALLGKRAFTVPRPTPGDFGLPP